MLTTSSGNIVISVIPQADGHFVCEATLTFEGRTSPTRSFHGQSSNHALAIALEDLAREFRMEADAEQKLDWLAVDRSPSGEVIEKRFHFVLHYECVTSDESKFEARHSILLGNTVIENAEISMVQVDADLPLKPCRKVTGDERE